MIDMHDLQKRMKEFWKTNKVYETLYNRSGKNFWVLDGPPYANGVPHIGHVKNTVFKDIAIRKAFMQGNKVMFKPGFDTHGLPIENMVEKAIGLQSKKDIETFGIDKFMQECKNNAALNKNLWMEVYEKLNSVFANQEPYMTYDNSYIEGGWWAFNEMYKKGLIYHGEKPVMWCPHCETSLAGYEVTDSYKDVTDPGVYVLFKLEKDHRFVLVYTTTPWTLPANVAIAVAPEEDYSTVQIGEREIIIAREQLEKLSKWGLGYNIVENWKGKDLVGKKYEPLLDVPVQRELATQEKGKAHEIIASIPLLKERVASKMRTKKDISGGDLFEEFVTVKEGTGFVHVAPGHGKTDFFVGQEYGLAKVSPVNDHCELLPESGFSGFVKKADKAIIEHLKNNDRLLHQESIVHSYPLCWRCKSPLIFRLSNQLFLKLESLKETILKENKKVSWKPEFAQERFEHWVSNAEDWNISRQRYWGIPIPLWNCENCRREKVITNKFELEKLSGKQIDDLHVAESLHIKCECGGQMKKIPGILDVWFDSGVAPWASLGYPMQSKEEFESHFPVDRINEAQDQIRGWFYSLMVCSAAVFGKSPYKEVSMVGWVVDRKGIKMSKSVGNVISAEQALQELGSDMLRYYFCWDSAPYDIQKFNVDIAKKEVGKIFTILWNIPNLANSGKITIESVEDEWILSRLESMTKEYQKALDNFETHNALRLLSDFIVNELSRGYMQMTRDREPGIIIGHCMERIVRLIAPIVPSYAEALWQELRNKKIVHELSVHLTSWPKIDENKINSKLEEEIKKALKIVELGLAERDKIKIGLRWPLASVKVYCEELGEESKELIKRQLNVKQVFVKKSEEIKIELDTTTNEKLEGEGYSRELMRKVQEKRKESGLQKKDLIELNIYTDGEMAKMLKENEKSISDKTNSNVVRILTSPAPDNAVVLTVKERKISFIFRNS